MTAGPLHNEKGNKELTEELEDAEDSVCKVKHEVYEIQSMNTEKASLLKTFTIFVGKD